MADTQTTGRAGRGFLWLTAAKLHFMLAGWVIYFVLPRLMGTAEFGEFLVVVGLVTILNNVMVSSAIQATSRFTASHPDAMSAVLRASFVLFAVTGLVFAGGLLGLGAPWIARAEADPALARLYRVAAPVALAYALYAVCIGSLNGRQRFGAQAAFDASYATLRVGLMVGGAALATSAVGGLAGYSTAAVLICLVALIFVGRHAFADKQRMDGLTGKMLLFVAPLALHQVGVNLLMRTDLLMMKALGGRTLPVLDLDRLGTLALGHTAAAGTSPAEAASVLSAHYGTAQIFALVPYQALIALAMVVFPLVADAASSARRERLQKTAAGALRFALIFGAGLAAILAAQPAGIIDIVYPASYRAGGVALGPLAFGVLGLSLITLCCAMLNAAGHTLRVVILTFGAWALQAALVTVALTTASSPEQALRLTAFATSAALATGGLAAVLTVHLTFGVSVRGLTVLRVALAAAAAVAVGSRLSGNTFLPTVAASLLGFVTFPAVLLLTRELSRADLGAVTGLLRRG